MNQFAIQRLSPLSSINAAKIKTNNVIMTISAPNPCRKLSCTVIRPVKPQATIPSKDGQIILTKVHPYNTPRKIPSASIPVCVIESVNGGINWKPNIITTQIKEWM